MAPGMKPDLALNSSRIFLKFMFPRTCCQGSLMGRRKISDVT